MARYSLEKRPPYFASLAELRAHIMSEASDGGKVYRDSTCVGEVGKDGGGYWFETEGARRRLDPDGTLAPERGTDEWTCNGEGPAMPTLAALLEREVAGLDGAVPIGEALKVLGRGDGDVAVRTVECNGEVQGYLMFADGRAVYGEDRTWSQVDADGSLHGTKEVKGLKGPTLDDADIYALVKTHTALGKALDARDVERAKALAETVREAAARRLAAGRLSKDKRRHLQTMLEESEGMLAELEKPADEVIWDTDDAGRMMLAEWSRTDDVMFNVNMLAHMRFSVEEVCDWADARSLRAIGVSAAEAREIEARARELDVLLRRAYDDVFRRAVERVRELER